MRDDRSITVIEHSDGSPTIGLSGINEGSGTRTSDAQHLADAMNATYDDGNYGGKDIPLPDVAAAVEPMGFDSMFFTDEYEFTAERGELKLAAHHEADGLRVFVAGDDEWEMGRAAGDIRQVLGLQER